VSPMGGSRRLAAALAMVVGIGVLAGCSQMSNPTYDVGAVGCSGVSDATLHTIGEKLTVDGRLRNGKSVKSPTSKDIYVSAELHLASAQPHDKGDILTWVTTDPEGSDFKSVDVHAREDSSWPHADVDVRAEGARESRACAELSAGKTKAQIQCERDQANGSVSLPGGKSCSDL
jgi:hypothetical protein